MKFWVSINSVGEALTWNFVLFGFTECEEMVKKDMVILSIYRKIIQI